MKIIKENLLRNMVKKKSVIVYVLKGEVQLVRHVRKKHEKKVMEKAVRKVEKEDRRIVEEVAEVT